MGQFRPNMSRAELLVLLRDGKQDTTRIQILHDLGRFYLKEIYSDKKALMMDTAIQIFHHATMLSDTLKSKGFWYESTLLEGEGYLYKDDTAEGKKRFFEIAAIYHAKGDKEREGRTWLRLAKKTNRQPGNFNDIESYFAKAAVLYRQAHNVEREAAVHTSRADFLFVTGRPALAEGELLVAIDSLNKIGGIKVSDSYFMLSVINRYRGSFEKSLLYATKCVETAQRNNDTGNIGVLWGELALVYDELGRSAESAQWYSKTLYKLLEKNTERVYIFRTAGLLMQQWVKQKKVSRAFSLFDSLVMVYHPQNALEKAVVAQNYAYCYAATKQYPEAETYFLAMIANYNIATGSDEEGFSRAHIDAGRFYFQHGQFNKAKIYLDTAVQHIAGTLLSNQKEAYQMLFSADSALGNYAAAVKDLKQYQYLNDSIFNDRKSRQIEELTIQYETEKKEQSIKLLEQESRLQKAELKQFRYTTSWVLGVTVLLVVITGLAINYSRLKQRTNDKLLIQQRQIENKNDSLQRLVKEKDWLVKEIHHRVKNNFHIVMGLLRTQCEYLEGDEAIQAINESSQRIQAMSLIHQKLYQSENLSAINIAGYIYELVDYLKESFNTGYKAQFNLQIEPVNLNLSYCVPLGLILNEAITNALKYAFPGNRYGTINVSFNRISQKQFRLSIKDNGIGLPAGFNSERTATMGMKLIRGLSDDIDAKLNISSNYGTEISVSFICDDGIQLLPSMDRQTVNAE